MQKEDGILPDEVKRLIKQKFLLDESGDFFLQFCNKHQQVLGAAGTPRRKAAQRYRRNVIRGDSFVNSPELKKAERARKVKKTMSKSSICNHTILWFQNHSQSLSLLA